MQDKLRIYDNGGETYDRYTVLRLDWPEDNNCVQAFGMSEDPIHPQGFGQHCAAQPGRHLGKRIQWDDLPKRCQSAARHFREGLE